MSAEKYSEKVSVNINSSTLSCIDLLVDNGYYSNRSDFINQALREGLQRHQTTIDRIIERNSGQDERSCKRWFVGIYSVERYELEVAKEHGQALTYTGYGVLVIDKSMDEELLFGTIQSVNVKGKVVCSNSVKEHYGLK